MLKNIKQLQSEIEITSFTFEQNKNPGKKAINIFFLTIWQKKIDECFFSSIRIIVDSTNLFSLYTSRFNNEFFDL